MRVTHVAPSGFGSGGLFGGGERYPLELARAISVHVPCRLITFGRSNESIYDDSGLEIRVIRAVRWLGHPAHALFWPGGIFADTDVVHLHQLHAAPTRISALLAGLRGQAVVGTDHGLEGHDRFGIWSRQFRSLLLVSRESARLLDAAPSKTTIIYGGCDTGLFRPRGGSAREGILFVGRITPHKGLDVLLRALPKDIPLTVVGTVGHDPRPPESGYPAMIRRLAQGKKVSFRHAVADRELADIYRSARVFILPTVSQTCYGRRIRSTELLSLSTLEAMSSGTAVLCSRIGALPEIVKDGENGILFGPGDVEELRSKLTRLYEDQELAGALGDRARATVLERFTWEACARRCLKAYRSLNEAV